MKIYISDRGDMSVGIHPNTMDVELNWSTVADDERTQLRKHFAAFAKDVLDFCYGRIEVTFEDECPTCHDKLKLVGRNMRCPNKYCPENFDELEVSR